MKKLIPAVLALALGGAFFVATKNFQTGSSCATCENPEAAPVQVAGGNSGNGGK